MKTNTPRLYPANSKGKITPSSCGVKGQSKSGSALESLVNIAGGFGVGLLAQLFIFPLFNINIDVNTNVAIAVCFSFVSFARSYAFRRLFNMIQVRKDNGK